MPESLSEQVAALEAECDYLRQRVHEVCDAAARDLNRAEERERTARVEGARAQQEAFVAGAVYAYARGGKPHMMPGNWQAEAARRYPAPSAHAGEARPVASTTLCVCGHSSYDHYGYDTGKRGCVADGMRCACDDFRPAFTPEPEPPLVRLDVEQGTMAVFMTPADCRRIVALGSRPTQTAED